MLRTVMQRWTQRFGLGVVGIYLAGAAAAAPLPDNLDAYGVVKSDGKTLTITGNTMVYGLSATLFTDYALKFRTLTLPVGSTVGYKADGALDFPVGTIISKTFYYARDPKNAGGWLKTAAVHAGESIDLAQYQMVETRILQREADGNWIANTYIWNPEQTSAALRRIGYTVKGSLRDPAGGGPQAFDYLVPNARQCQSCHAVNSTIGQAGIEPIGPKAKHMNLDYGYAGGSMNQLKKLGTVALWKDLPADLAGIGRTVAYTDTKASTEARARAYVDINCAHCHHKLGDARQSGLFLSPDATGSHLGVCKQHVAAGSGGANLTFDIVPGKPDQSLLVTRMEATSGQAMMPRMGRSLVDKEGVALMRAWVSSMNGNCDR